MCLGCSAGGGLAFLNNIPVIPGDVHNGFVGEGGDGIFVNGTHRWVGTSPGVMQQQQLALITRTYTIRDL
jgi:hypothetical protein